MSRKNSIIRPGAGKAFQRFLIGILITVIIAFVIYAFVVKGNFSDRINTQNYTPRDYDWWTDTEGYMETLAASTMSPEEESVLAGMAVSSPTPVPTQSPTPSPSPTPEPTPEPTPVPTQVPESEYAQESKINLKQAKEKLFNLGVSKLQVANMNDGWLLEIAGWCNVDDTEFDGENAKIKMLIKDRNGSIKAYDVKKVSGASGQDHLGEGKNLFASDFKTYLDIDKYPDGEYEIGMAVAYTRKGSQVTLYYSTGRTFWVYNGRLVD